MDIALYNELKQNIAWQTMPAMIETWFDNEQYDAIYNHLSTKDTLQLNETLLLSELCLDKGDAMQANQFYASMIGQAMMEHDYFVKRFCLLLQHNNYYDICYNILFSALQYMPRSYRLLNLIGTIHLDLNQPKKAEKIFRYYNTMFPTFFDGYNNMVVALQQQGRYIEAKDMMHRALNLPNQHLDANLHFGLALHELRYGSLVKGTRMMFWRFINNPHIIAPYAAMMPLWQGDALHDKTLLITTEQGFGDYIMYMRFIEHVKHIYPTCRIYLVVRQELQRYVAHHMSQFYELAYVKHDTLTPCDYYIPLMHIPAVIAMDYEAITPISYTQPYPIIATTPSIGLCYQGKTRHIKADSIKNLLDIMKQPVQALQLSSIDHAYLAPLPPTINDFYDTASIIYNIDIIITIDSAIAHIAGLMGKEVILLNDYNYCWRWQQTQTNKEHYSLWYPKLRIMRTHDSTNNFDNLWPEVINHIHTLQNL